MDKEGRTYVYCVHWAQNAQIRPVRFFSNFKGPVHSSVGCYIEDILCLIDLFQPLVYAMTANMLHCTFNGHPFCKRVNIILHELIT